jgi:acyl-CoA thioesterase-1
MAQRDLRICFLGDSFVNGTGDPRYMGWVGGLAQRTQAAGVPLTCYNLGIRGETTALLVARAPDEMTRRLTGDFESAIVISTGTNDTNIVDGKIRVAPSESIANIKRLVSTVKELGRVLVIGPPAVPDAAHNQRNAALDRAFAQTVASQAVPYIGLQQFTAADSYWLPQASRDDGYHPGREAYDNVAAFIAADPRWRAFVGLAPVD